MNSSVTLLLSPVWGIVNTALPSETFPHFRSCLLDTSEGSSEGEVVEVTVPNNRFAGTVCLSEDGRLAVEPDGCRGG